MERRAFAKITCDIKLGFQCMVQQCFHLGVTLDMADNEGLCSARPSAGDLVALREFPIRVTDNHPVVVFFVERFAHRLLCLQSVPMSGL